MHERSASWTANLAVEIEWPVALRAPRAGFDWPTGLRSLDTTHDAFGSLWVDFELVGQRLEARALLLPFEPHDADLGVGEHFGECHGQSGKETGRR